MAYSSDITKLNSYLSSISNVDLKTNFDWEGSAKAKQVQIINGLKSELDNQKGFVETLIVALSAIDAYDSNKTEYDKICSAIGNLDTNAENYNSVRQSYESSKNAYKAEMDRCKNQADIALRKINSSYSNKLNNITVTKAVDTTIDLLPSGLFDRTLKATENTKEKTPVLTSNNNNISTTSTPTYSSSNYNYSSSPSYSSYITPHVTSSSPGNYVVETIDMSNVPPAPTERICAANTNLNIKSTRKDITSCFSKETQDIVSRHANDFNYSNFRNYIKNDEDFEKYCKEVLGGVFAKWVGKNKKGEGKTASEFQEIAEYVFGLMVMYGFDYCNGKAEKYGKFGADNKEVASNAFYPEGVYNSESKENCTNGANIDEICAGTTKDGINMTTNCNYGMDYLYHKAGILGVDGAPDSSCAVGSLARYAQSKGGGVTTNASELKVGDLIQCYRNDVPSSAATVDNAGNLKDYNWYHVCCVGEVEKNAAGQTVAVVLYDAGHRFTNGGNFKYRVELNNGNLRSLGDYGNRWVGINMNLTQDSYTTVS